MKNKFFFCCLLCSSTLFAAPNSSGTQRLQNLEREVNSVQQQITDLQQKIHAIRLKEMNEEISSQPLMLDHEWSEYTGKLQKAEDYDNEANKLEADLAKIKLSLKLMTDELNKALPKK